LDNNDLAALTADIVAAHVSNNSVAVNDMPNLIRQVHAALAALEQGAPEPTQSKSPVVSIRASVKPDYIVCMECGKKQKTLRRHLQTAHNMTPDQYRKDYGLPDSYPLTAPNYSETRRAMAKSFGLGRPAKKEAEAAAPAGPAKRGRKSKADANQ
jgi:predicted transcriptional regulator